MQHEVTKPVELLDKKGHIIEEGWARKPYWNYDRSKIHGSAWRIKEWDYYAVVNQEKGYAITATMSDIGYGSLFALSYVDYLKGTCAQDSAMSFFTFGKLGLTKSSEMNQEVSWANKKIRFAFVNKGTKRHVMFASPSLILPDGSVGLDVNITLTQPPEMESISIATSWKENRKAFYLNQKTNCMAVSGTIGRGWKKEKLEEGEAWGILDWGRGRWTYTNTWYWGSASGSLEGIPFGFNLGYGFSDRTPASENGLFYKGKVHKLDIVEFHIPTDSYMKPWTFSSNDKRLELDFEPRCDRQSSINVKVVKSIQHQVFGYFSGTVILDDGQIVKLNKFPGFAEKVFNRW
ncbi:MAG: DUF2804 domain-containing protein [Sphaerochaetaceae bacterium]